jgi:hypothetical protein
VLALDCLPLIYEVEAPRLAAADQPSLSKPFIPDETQYTTATPGPQPRTWLGLELSLLRCHTIHALSLLRGCLSRETPVLLGGEAGATIQRIAKGRAG